MAGLGIVLAACGGGSAAPGTTTTSSTPAASGSSTSTSAPVSSTTAPTATTSPASEVTALSGIAKEGQSKTFSATWTSTSNSATTTVTEAQSPPKTLFKTGSGFLLNDGKNSYFCSSSSQCVEETGTNPLASVLNLYNGRAFLSSVQAYESATALREAGVTLTFTEATYGGQASKCVNVSAASGKSKWCVSQSSGILTYWSAAGNSFTLTSFSASPPASDFALPAGVTVVTLPSGVSIPSIPQG